MSEQIENLSDVINTAAREAHEFFDKNHVTKGMETLLSQDKLVVWKLDRLSRSLRDVLTIMERLGEAEAGFRSLTEAIDTTTPAGRMMIKWS